VDCRDHGWHRIGRHRPNSCPPESEFVGRSLQKGEREGAAAGLSGIVVLLCLCPAPACHAEWAPNGATARRTPAPVPTGGMNAVMHPTCTSRIRSGSRSTTTYGSIHARAAPAELQHVHGRRGLDCGQRLREHHGLDLLGYRPGNRQHPRHRSGRARRGHGRCSRENSCRAPGTSSMASSLTRT
jgi:hypothetical protein